MSKKGRKPKGPDQVPQIPNEIQYHKVTDQDGVQAAIFALDQNHKDSTGQSQMLIELETGARLVVPLNLLVETANGDYYLLANFKDLKPEQANSQALEQSESKTQVRSGSSSAGAEAEDKAKETLVVPILSERVSVEKRLVEKGQIVLQKHVTEHDEVVDEPLLQDEYRIERVVVNQEVSSPPPIRYEGDTMIIPVLQEVLVVEKRLMVKEELHLIKQQITTSQPQTVSLRAEEIVVENLPPHS